MNTILVDTLFSGPRMGGGQRRSAQIAYLLDRAGFQVANFRIEDLADHRQRFLTGVSFVASSRFPVQMSSNAIRLCGWAVQGYRHALSQHRGAKLLIRERTEGVGKIAPLIARDYGFRTLAVPHNIESLVPEQVETITRPRSGFRSLQNEIDQFKHDSASVCISREEQWLLNVSGVQAGFLPYFPIPDDELNLLRLRIQRKPAKPKKFLVLGSACNPPVRRGIMELVSIVGPIAVRRGYRIEVVGNQVNELRLDSFGGAVVNRGRLSDTELAEIMSETSAAIVFQRQGCGALTKIPELLVAGIPVFGNANAIRSTSQYEGVYEFDTIDELESLMLDELPMPVPPSRPTVLEERFVKLLSSMGS